MHSTLARVLLALVASLVLGCTAASAGTARGGGGPGVTDTSILLGGTAPLTGASSHASVARGAEAYFKYVNARGGVSGRTITYRVADDASNTAQGMSLTRQLVEQDRVFAVFNSVGTATNLAVRPYLTSLKVPQLFVGSGGTTFGRDYAEYPYTIGFQPSNQVEGWVYGKYLARTAPGATVAVLFENAVDGTELLAGLKSGLERSKAKVIAAQPYDPLASPDVSAQIAKLKSSGADTLAIFATPAFATQAYDVANRLGWNVKRVINSSAASSATVMLQASDGGRNKLVNRTISIAFLKDPTDARWTTDSGMRLYRTILNLYAPGANQEDSQLIYGMAVAWTVVEALRKAGRNLTRSSLQRVLANFTAGRSPFLVPGVAIRTAGTDHFPVEQMQLQRWQGAAWQSFGGLWSYRAT